MSATISTFESYLKSLSIIAAETEETATSFMAFVSPENTVKSNSIQKRFTCVNITKKDGKMYQGLRLAKVDVLNFGITQGYFGFDVKGIMDAKRKQFRATGYRGQIK